MRVARQKNLSSTMATESTDSRARAAARNSSREPGPGRNQFGKGEILLDAAGPVSDTAVRASAVQTLRHTCTSVHTFVHKITVALIILQDQCPIV